MGLCISSSKICPVCKHARHDACLGANCSHSEMRNCHCNHPLHRDGPCTQMVHISEQYISSYRPVACKVNQEFKTGAKRMVSRTVTRYKTEMYEDDERVDLSYTKTERRSRTVPKERTKNYTKYVDVPRWNPHHYRLNDGAWVNDTKLEYISETETYNETEWYDESTTVPVFENRKVQKERQVPYDILEQQEEDIYETRTIDGTRDEPVYSMRTVSRKCPCPGRRVTCRCYYSGFWSQAYTAPYRVSYSPYDLPRYGLEHDFMC